MKKPEPLINALCDALFYQTTICAADEAWLYAIWIVALLLFGYVGWKVGTAILRICTRVSQKLDLF